MLSHEEVEKHLLRIFSGKEVVMFEKDNDNLFIAFKHPSNDIKIQASIIYKDAYTKAIKEGMFPTEELEKLIVERGLFTEEDQKRVDKLENQIEAQKILLAKTVKVAAKQDRIKEIIERYEKQLREIQYKKQSKLNMSAESKAEEMRSSFYCWACTYDFKSDERYWKSLSNFDNDKDSKFKEKVFIRFLQFFSGIPTAELRYIARHNLWRIRYVTSQKTSESLFGIPTSEYNNDQLSLVYWSNYYQNIYEMMPENRPSDSIIEDDAALDAYMEEYYKERNKEDASRRSRETKGKLSAFDKEEVIITRTNELYEDIEYDKPREAQRLKDKEISSIKKRTRRGRR
jgi:hypothetical protein